MENPDPPEDDHRKVRILLSDKLKRSLKLTTSSPPKKTKLDNVVAQAPVGQQVKENSENEYIDITGSSESESDDKNTKLDNVVAQALVDQQVKEDSENEYVDITGSSSSESESDDKNMELDNVIAQAPVDQPQKEENPEDKDVNIMDLIESYNDDGQSGEDSPETEKDTFDYIDEYENTYSSMYKSNLESMDVSCHNPSYPSVNQEVASDPSVNQKVESDSSVNQNENMNAAVEDGEEEVQQVVQPRPNEYPPT